MLVGKQAYFGRVSALELGVLFWGFRRSCLGFLFVWWWWILIVICLFAWVLFQRVFFPFADLLRALSAGNCSMACQKGYVRKQLFLFLEKYKAATRYCQIRHKSNTGNTFFL